MTRRKKTILFLFLLILFLIAAPITVLYSLGWRFNWETKRIFQPGVFYFKVWPKSAEVFLNDKLAKKTDFFFGSLLIENLFPKKYNVEIKKDGFYSWQKTLEIKEREVTEAKNIILIPENPELKILFKGVKAFFFTPDEKKIIIKEKDDKGWSLKLFEIDKNVKSHLLKERDISKQEVQLIDLRFSQDSKRIILEVGLKERLMFYLLEIDEVPLLLTQLDFLGIDVEKVYFNPKNPQKLFVLENGKLSEVDLITKKTSLTRLENIVTFSVLENNVYYLDNSGFLYKTDLSFGPGDKLNIIPLPLKAETEYKIIVFDSKIAFQGGDILYTFDENKKSFQKIFEPVKDLQFSPDSKKLAYFNDYEIWVLFLEKIREMPQKEAGEKLFITRFSEKIGQVFWHNDHYLIFNVSNKIKIAEIDNRDRINIVDLAELKNPEIFWANKKLYILSETNLYVSDELTP